MQRFARMLSDNPKQACGLDASSVQAEKSAEAVIGGQERCVKQRRYPLFARASQQQECSTEPPKSRTGCSKATNSSRDASRRRRSNLGEREASRRRARVKVKHTGIQCCVGVASMSRSTQCSVPKMSKGTQLGDPSWIPEIVIWPCGSSNGVQKCAATKAVGGSSGRLPVRKAGHQCGRVLTSSVQQSAEGTSSNRISFKGGTKTYSRVSKPPTCLDPKA
ncbi:hypothetical protein V5799_016317 [Amblyomma americanum]|uniref:Uncharacterized protein n=1 Tax=Amblyomma americanum TaxID=6943 RepID=A0AAQ4F640_AMBAM